MQNYLHRCLKVLIHQIRVTGLVLARRWRHFYFIGALTEKNVLFLCINIALTVNILAFHRYIDQGRNPQLYTKECLERALARNEQVKGKIDTMTVRGHRKILASGTRVNISNEWFSINTRWVFCLLLPYCCTIPHIRCFWSCTLGL